MFTTVVLLGLIVLSVIVFVLVVGFQAPRARTPLIAEAGFTAAPAPAGVNLISLAESLLNRYNIALDSRVETGPAEITLHAQSRDPLIGGRYIVVCHSCAVEGLVPPTRLLEFRDEVKATGATKGVFLTDGFFTSDARYLLEDAPVSLINRHDLESLERAAAEAARAVPARQEEV